jgi:hypothetical protein
LTAGAEKYIDNIKTGFIVNAWLSGVIFSFDGGAKDAMPASGRGGFTEGYPKYFIPLLRLQLREEDNA